MNKKKLLIVAHHLTIGGVQKSLISALKAIDYEKFDVTLYLRKNRTDLLSLVDERVNVIINDDNHHYYRKPYAVILQMLILLFKLLGKKEKTEKFNKKLSDSIVKWSMEYERKRFFSSEKYDIAISYLEGYTVLFTSECINANKKYFFFRSSTDDFHNIHVPIIDNFDKVLALHNNQKELIGTWYPSIKNRIYIIENYTDKDFITAQSKEYIVEKPKEKLVLCSCGRLAKVKGFDLAVEAAKILKGKDISFLWYFVGDGPERENIDKLIEKYNLQEEIIITGMQKNPYPYMNACDVYVQPSYAESLGNTIVEAHKLYKPVITTATLGGKKLVEPNINGLVCSISSEGIAQSIETILNNPKLRSSIEQNLKNIDYSEELEIYKTQWQNLLEE